MDKNDKTTQATKKYRKKSERPRPDLPPDAEENRSRKLVTTRLEPEFIKAVNERVKLEGKTFQQFVEDALKDALDKPVDGINPPE